MIGRHNRKGLMAFNEKTRQLKKLDLLTQAEKKTGNWGTLPDDVDWLRTPKTKSDTRRDEYMEKVRAKHDRRNDL